MRKLLTTLGAGIGILATMQKPRQTKSQHHKGATEIYRGRQPNRPHHVEDWAVRRNYKDQAALVKALGVDKSVVSRWYNGATPSKDWQARLVELFSLDDPEDLFRDPDDDWLAKFFKNRDREEIEHIKRSMETTFPRKISSK